MKLYLGGLYNLGSLLQKSCLIFHLEGSVNSNFSHSRFFPSATEEFFFIRGVLYYTAPKLGLAACTL